MTTWAVSLVKVLSARNTSRIDSSLLDVNAYIFMREIKNYRNEGGM